MENISFKSSIRPVTRKEFSQIVSNYGSKNFIDYPWTVKESVLSNKVYTKGVEDCSFLGLTDGLRVLGMHICPTIEENFDFSKIKHFIMKKIDLRTSGLQGILLGARRHSEENRSFNLFDNFELFLKKHSIPYSKFKDGRDENDIAYDSKTDEWVVSSRLAEIPDIKNQITAKGFLEHLFNDVEISELDETKW